MLLKPTNHFYRLILLLLCISLSNLNSKVREEVTGKNESIKIVKNNPLIVELEYKAEAILGEGALWNYKTQVFYWIDIMGNAFHIYNPKTKMNKTYKTPSQIGTVVPFTKEEVVLALVDGVYILNLKTS